MLQCAVFPHNPVHHTLRSLLLFMHFFLVNRTSKSQLKHGPKTTGFFALFTVKPKRVKTCLRQGASSGALRGRFRRGPLTSRRGGGVAASPQSPVHWSGPVYWHMTQPVHTVLPRAARAQPYKSPAFDGSRFGGIAALSLNKNCRRRDILPSRLRRLHVQLFG